MKKFMLRRVGVADDRFQGRPSLHDCIEVVLQQADTLIDDVIEGLAPMAGGSVVKGKSSLGDRSPIAKSVADSLRAQESSIKSVFVARLQTGVYNAGSEEFADDALVRFEDLQLLDSKQIDASIEHALAMQEVARCVEDVLPALNGLVSSLLGWITSQPHLNPLKPDPFVRALQASLVQHVTDESARAALMIPAAGFLGVGLRQLYREICDWLRSQGVEPAARVGALASGGGAVRDEGSQSSVTRTLVTLDKLRRLLAGELHGSSQVQDFMHTVPASFVALEDMKLVEPMMRRLQMRAKLPQEAVLTESDALAEQTEREPTQSKKLGRQLGAEVVRMMLDNLMQDDRLLLQVRELIKRLEPVLLRLSRTDPRFFSERLHPARRFLDRVTDRSMGYSAESDEGFPKFLAMITKTVGALVDGAWDTDAFAEVVTELDEVWAREDIEQRRRHEEEARALLHAEQRNLLAQRLAEDFRKQQKVGDIPELVVGFLRGPWSQVVAESQLGCVDGSVDPDGYLALVDELLWSVQPRLARRNQNRLVQLVPKLLVKLRQGLMLIDYPEERIPVFFDALITLHEKVFEGGRRMSGESATGSLPEDADALAGEVDRSYDLAAAEFWDDEDEADDVLGSASDDQSLGTTAQRPWSIGDLNIGVWVELQVEQVWLRAQLTWASPHRTLFMFVSRGGLAHSMSRRSMERLRMKGSIRFVSDGHLVDNALDAVAQAALQNDLGQAKQGA